MRLLDIFKKKNSVDSNETKSKVVENNVVNNINDNKKFEGKYSFLNNFKHLSVFTGLSDEEINSYSQEFFEKFKIDLPEDVKEFLKVTNGLFGAGGEYFLSKFNDEVKNIKTLDYSKVPISNFFFVRQYLILLSKHIKIE